MWQPYGVAIEVDAAPACHGAGTPLVVAFDDVQERRSAEPSGLGTIRFGKNGAPESRIVLNYRVLVGLVTAGPVMGLDLSAWPVALREQIIGRALGRALAHEIGHFVLRSPHHSDSGLMRPEYRASALTDPMRNGLGLTWVERTRLQIVRAAAPELVAVKRSDGAHPILASSAEARSSCPSTAESVAAAVRSGQ